MSLPKYGSREGLTDRLDDWIERMCKDKSLPWMGMGLIADMKIAVAVLRGEPEKKPDQEYDL